MSMTALERQKAIVTTNRCKIIHRSLSSPSAERETDRVHARAPASQERSPDERPSADSPPLHDDRQPTPRGGLLRRHRFALMLGLALFVPAATAGYLYCDNSGHFESTDDAYIAARQFAIQPKVSGYITAVPVTDNQRVATSDVIAHIDDRDYRIALEEAQPARSYCALICTALKSSLPWKCTTIMQSPPSSHLS